MVMLTAARIGDLFGSTVAVDESPTGAEVDFQDLREEAELDTRHEIRQEALRFAFEEGEKESIAQEETEDTQIRLKLNRRKEKRKSFGPDYDPIYGMHCHPSAIYLHRTRMPNTVPDR